MPVRVPAQYQSIIDAAAVQTGIPEAVVAAQINYESGFNPNARSSAGAEGFAQFLPSTFRAYGPPGGNIWSPQDSMIAYANFMNALEKDFHGDLRNALAGYNAGPGNYRAGLGYADFVLRAAGVADMTVQGGSASALAQPGTTSAVPALNINPNPLSPGGGILGDFPGFSTLNDIDAAARKFVEIIQWIIGKFPEMAIRAIELMFGVVGVVYGLLLIVVILAASGTPDSIKEAAAFGIGLAFPESKVAKVIGAASRSSAPHVARGASTRRAGGVPRQAARDLDVAPRANGKRARPQGAFA